jgi:solute carrier family 30 (zinc transporter), member 1
MVHAAEEMASAQSSSPTRTALAAKRSGVRNAIDPELSDARLGRLSDVEDRSEPDEEDGHAHDHDHDQSTERTPLIGDGNARAPPKHQRVSSAHGSGHGHSHGGGSMNMHALLLHVLGDALGNVGVIAAGLVIWLTEWRFKYEFDPFISLVITVIIFSTALPLVRSTSYILLQGVPNHVSSEDVKQSILNVPGVLSLHELHIWQLSESKVVASVHVKASKKHDFMTVAAEIRNQLHQQGIHSSTIQPEYHQDQVAEEHLITASDASCLIECPADELCTPAENACCRKQSLTLSS